MSKQYVREFDSSKEEVFEIIKKRVLGRSEENEGENTFSLNIAGSNINYRLKDYIENEKIKADISSKNVKGSLDILFRNRQEGGSILDIDIDLKNNSILGGILGRLISPEKMINRLVYEIKKELGEI